MLCLEEIDMKFQRHNAIRELVAHALVANQDELRRKLRRRGFEVTQATLSRDIHELQLTKGPGGYSLPNGNGNGNGAGLMQREDARRRSAEMMESFGLEREARDEPGGAADDDGRSTAVAAALDREAGRKWWARSPATIRCW